jgi:hypothetical protein
MKSQTWADLWWIDIIPSNFKSRVYDSVITI